MTNSTKRPRGGLADKRRAILTGALTVFARDGYTRASIDVIAAQAGVSTRTIYNHFGDKAGLFQAVIQESGSRVADAEIAVIDRHLRKVTDPEADLIEFGLAWAGPMAEEHAEHISLVRQVNAEAGHIPPDAIDAWQRTGPLRVRGELAERLRQMAELGQLRLAGVGAGANGATDAELDRAAVHLLLLISVFEPSYRAKVPTESELTDMVTAGVHAFLHGYGS